MSWKRVLQSLNFVFSKTLWLRCENYFYVMPELSKIDVIKYRGNRSGKGTGKSHMANCLAFIVIILGESATDLRCSGKFYKPCHQRIHTFINHLLTFFILSIHCFDAVYWFKDRSFIPWKMLFEQLSVPVVKFALRVQPIETVENWLFIKVCKLNGPLSVCRGTVTIANSHLVC